MLHLGNVSRRGFIAFKDRLGTSAIHWALEPTFFIYQTRFLDMRRRHLPALIDEQITLCGHSATVQEYRRMKTIKFHEVTCKRCLAINERIKHREMESLQHEESVKVAAET